MRRTMNDQKKRIFPGFLAAAALLAGIAAMPESSSAEDAAGGKILLATVSAAAETDLMIGDVETETELLTGDAKTGSDRYSEDIESETGSLIESEETETETGTPDSGTDSEETDLPLTLSQELSEEIAVLTGIETEASTEEETEPETETETETTETEIEKDGKSTNMQLKQAFLDYLEELFPDKEFQIPMTAMKPDAQKLMKDLAAFSCGDYSVRRAKRVHPWEQEHTLKELEELIQTTLEGYDGVWSVYVKNLDTDESFVINDEPLKSASVMKLFIMGTVYTAFADGELERTDEIMSLVNAMISYSDNTASNQLLYILGDSSYADGIAKVNAFIQSHGYSEMTVEYNGFSNSATNSGNGVNQVAAKDVGKLLEDIYRRTWMNRSDSNEMEEMLLAQHTRYKIPAGLPDGVLCANKTGETSTTQNDAAIIYSDACDYILVILSNDWSSSDAAVTRIANLSKMVYEFFN